MNFSSGVEAHLYVFSPSLQRAMNVMLSCLFLSRTWIILIKERFCCASQLQSRKKTTMKMTQFIPIKYIHFPEVLLALGTKEGLATKRPAYIISWDFVYMPMRKLSKNWKDEKKLYFMNPIKSSRGVAFCERECYLGSKVL